MTNNRDIEELRSILERVDTQTSYCDNKIVAALGCLGVMIGVFLATDFIGKVLVVITYFIESISIIHIIWLLLAGISIVAIILGAFSLLNALLGRIKPEVYENTGVEINSLIFWGSIASYSNYKDYSNKIERVDENVLKNDYISQIFICSKICQLKYMYYNNGLMQSSIGIVVYSILMVIGVFMKKYGF